MFERGQMLRVWIALTVLWTIVVAIWGWINLPRAQHIPHDPKFLSRLSNEAASILNGSVSQAERSRWGALIWSDTSFSVSMPNGARLKFPSTTTNEGVAFVKNEYHKLLEAEAGAKTRPYVLRMILAWLLALPILLVLDLAAGLICRLYQSAAQQGALEAAKWIKPREVARPLRVNSPPGYDSDWRWGAAGRHAELGF